MQNNDKSNDYICYHYLKNVITLLLSTLKRARGTECRIMNLLFICYKIVIKNCNTLLPNAALRILDSQFSIF